MANPAGAPARPGWSLRALETAPLPLLWLALSAAFYALLALYANSVGWHGPEAPMAPWHESSLPEALWAVVIGYVPTAILFALRGAACDLEALRPVLTDTREQFEARARSLLRFDPRAPGRGAS